MIWIGIVLAVLAALAWYMRNRSSDRDGYKAMNFVFKLFATGAIVCIGLGIIFAYLSHVGIDVVKYKGLIALAIIAIALANVKNQN